MCGERVVGGRMHWLEPDREPEKLEYLYAHGEQFISWN